MKLGVKRTAVVAMERYLESALACSMAMISPHEHDTTGTAFARGLVGML